eukprot:Opistho-2@94171
MEHQLLELVNGELREPTVLLDAWLCECNDPSVKIMPQKASSPASIEEAIALADVVHSTGMWLNYDLKQRFEILQNVAKSLEKYEEQMADADARTTGISINLTRAISGSIKGIFQELANGLKDIGLLTSVRGVHGRIEIERIPWGPTVVIAPWNVPVGTIAPKVAAALAAGAPVILKPSEWAPLSCVYFAKAIHESGLPPGIFQMVVGAGEVGARLVADSRIGSVNFTGSAATGRKVAHACIEHLKPVSLELGGSNPMVVFDDVHIEQAATCALQALTLLNGQWCAGLGRLIVHDKIKHKFVMTLLEKLAAVKMGSSMDTDAEMGPLAFSAHADMIRSKISELEKKGGHVLTATKIPLADDGSARNYVAPTVVEGLSMQDSVSVGEIFGPVATLHTFSTEREAVALANMAPAILMANVMCNDKERAFRVGRMIRSGLVMVNGVGFGFETTNAEPYFSMWGGAGLGDDGCLEVMAKFFSGTRVVGLNGKLDYPQVTRSSRMQHVAADKHATGADGVVLAANGKGGDPSSGSGSKQDNEFRQKFFRRLHITDWS